MAESTVEPRKQKTHVHRTTQDIVDVWDRIRYRMPGRPDTVIDKIYEVMEKLAEEVETEAGAPVAKAEVK